ncbi:MAG TPA: GntR family transcriptional regulator [Ramlibacter sp.]|nr:GntR family transcriptional regulator [Ramlibacter sp.]
MTRDTSARAYAAYETIKKRIIESGFLPGSKLSEERLAGELGLGRSPIRSAFARLNSEGWIDISPQSGSYVRALGEREIAEIFELRLVLESHVTDLAARRITDEQLRKLQLALKRTKVVAAAGADKAAFDEIDAVDSMVHLTIYEAAGNALISRILLNLWEKAQWLKKLVSPSTPARMKSWIAELEGIVEALALHDPRLAVQRVCDHVQHGEQSHQDSKAQGSRAAATPARAATSSNAPAKRRPAAKPAQRTRSKADARARTARGQRASSSR